jgi:serine/threonine protein kinase
MDHVKLYWPEWIADGVESESADSVVYRARREQFGETFYAAVKVTHVSAAPSAKPEVLKKINAWINDMEPLRTLSGLLVPDDVRVEETGDGFIVHTRMEYCQKLAAYAAEHALTGEELMEMGVDICTALDALAKKGLIHGDVRPEHIFVSKRGSYRLGGFSVTRALQPVIPAGIPEPSSAYYMAPEVYRGAPPSAQSDIYSLGMVLYRTLNGGRMPFLPPYPQPVTPQDRNAALARRMNGEPLPAPVSGDPDMIAPVMIACAAGPDERYLSAAAFRQAIREYLRSHETDSEGASEEPSAAAVRTPPRTPDTAAPREPARQTHRGMSPKLLATLIAVPIIVIVLGSVGILYGLGIIGGSKQTTAAATTTVLTTAATTTVPTTAATTTVPTTAATTTVPTTAATTTATSRHSTTATSRYSRITTTRATTTATTVAPFGDLLSEVSTPLTNDKNRTSNIILACSAINETVLQPGDEFSFNDIVGPRTVARGYKDAKIYAEGEVVDGIGGGICQVSSSLYLSCLYADLKITERRAHRYTVTYVPLGEDATVSWGSQDYKFVNDTDYPIKILSEVTGGNVHIQILGTKTENKRVELERKKLAYEPFETITTLDETMEPGTTRYGNASGHSGYKYQVYRCVYIDDKLVSRTLENTSTYTRLDVTIFVGPELVDTQMPDQSGTGVNNTPPAWLGGGTTSETSPDTSTSSSATSTVAQSTDASETTTSDNSQPPAWLGGGN